MTPPEVRAHVLAALGSYLGLYKRPDNSTAPAINVGAKTPVGYTIDPSGTMLEAVIGRSPRPGTDRSIFGGGSAYEDQWVVTLKAWGGTPVAEAGRVLAASWPGATRGPLVPESDVSIETISVMLPEFAARVP